jgi:DNA primase
MNIFNYVNSSVKIMDVINDYVTDLKEVDTFYKGICPFEKCTSNIDNQYIARFTVNPSKEVFYCFHCHKGGDVTSFIQEIKHITPNEAVLFIIEKYILKIDK